MDIKEEYGGSAIVSSWLDSGMCSDAIHDTESICNEHMCVCYFECTRWFL